MTTTLLPSRNTANEVPPACNHNCCRPAWHKALLPNDCKGRFWQKKPNLLFSQACQRYRLVQLFHSRVRVLVCVNLQCREPADHCVMASDTLHTTFLEDIQSDSWQKCEGYLFFLILHMSLVSHASDLEKAPMLSQVWRTFWQFLSLESAEPINRLHQLADASLQRASSSTTSPFVTAPLSNPCRSHKRGLAPSSAREPENFTPLRPRCW